MRCISQVDKEGHISPLRPLAIVVRKPDQGGDRDAGLELTPPAQQVGSLPLLQSGSLTCCARAPFGYIVPLRKPTASHSYAKPTRASKRHAFFFNRSSRKTVFPIIVTPCAIITKPLQDHDKSSLSGVQNDYGACSRSGGEENCIVPLHRRTFPQSFHFKLKGSIPKPFTLSAEWGRRWLCGRTIVIEVVNTSRTDESTCSSGISDRSSGQRSNRLVTRSTPRF
ncbi:hypothetical protein EVAR_103477_1 [Eumeta japonica]|uniref:Uncharacterized protein n=1 Tax=Eumeta variegata TaxID=151549 RepID=A0A4C1YZY1_EUMVA|nr:hypothetical protein EVAR_103477_1 [Eumeta japonica]